MRYITTALCALALTACSTQVADRTSTYQCGDRKVVVAGDTATVSSYRGTVVLPKTAAGNYAKPKASKKVPSFSSEEGKLSVGKKTIACTM